MVVKVQRKSQNSLRTAAMRREVMMRMVATMMNWGLGMMLPCCQSMVDRALGEMVELQAQPLVGMRSQLHHNLDRATEQIGVCHPCVSSRCTLQLQPRRR